MATVECAPGASVSLPTGRRLRPGQTADADLTHPEVMAAIEEGRLVLVHSFDVATAKVDDVIKWVGDDPERAAAALATERARPGRDQRSTLVGRLEGLVDTNDDPSEED